MVHPEVKQLAAGIRGFLATATEPVRLVDGIDTSAMQEWRQEFHRHPETAFEEVKTAAKVAELLAGWGVETHTNIGVTGVVGVLRGKGGWSSAICLRADMDALPVREASDHVPYASKTEGRRKLAGLRLSCTTPDLISMTRRWASARHIGSSWWKDLCP